ncbi:YbaN family protein [Iodidimonas sp. SYSU 1G8]|uniref:YbaN family protein n=1 Tax=Iodidimonas sp. SYSU 1G8 TaxID=3133967 RepID=UPI0031FEBC74
MDKQDDPAEVTLSPTARYLLLAVGWFFLALGAIGAFLPVLPTVPFLLITAWAWSKSSKRLHRWLYSNPTYGPYLIAWHKYGVIPRRAKIMAIGMMAAGWLSFTVFFATNWWVPALIAAVELAVGWFIITRPNAPPAIR